MNYLFPQYSGVCCRKAKKKKCSPPTFTRVLISESFGQTLLHKAAKPVNPCRRLSRHRSAQPCKMRPLLLLLVFFFPSSSRRYRVTQLSLPFNRISRGSCHWLRPRTSTPSFAVAEPLLFSLRQDVRGSSKASGLKYNLELAAANHKGSPGNNTRG